MNDQAAKLREKMTGKDQNIREQNIKEKNTRIIAMASGKGGVGKSNVSVNLGLALQETGKKVLLLDADLGMANIDILLGIVANYNLSHVLKGKCKFNEAVIKGPGDIDILAGTTAVDDLVNISSTEIKRLVEAASHMEENYDIIIIDIGAGVHFSVTNFIMACDEVVIILTPEPTAIMDAYSMIKVLSSKRYNGKMKLLLNQISSTKEGIELTERMQKVIRKYLDKDVDVFGMIPFDENVPQSVKKQLPFYIQYPRSEASRSIKEMAEKINNNSSVGEARGMKGFIYRIVGVFNRN